MEWLQSLCKHLLVLSALTMGSVYFYKDRLPDPSFYDLHALTAPFQAETQRASFATQAGGQEYSIKPRYDYELNGVIVSYNDADGMTDIWHHKRWKDFLNERDLCVIWGENAQSGVYKQMKFENDSWTCWAYWPDSTVEAHFKKDALSNNHLLVDDERIRQALQSAEPGDQIHLKGMLAEYANKANGFFRGTSVVRSDTGNGACETIYLTGFEVVKKANHGLRQAYSFAKGLALVSLVGFLILFFITPVRNI